KRLSGSGKSEAATSRLADQRRHRQTSRRQAHTRSISSKSEIAAARTAALKCRSDQHAYDRFPWRQGRKARVARCQAEVTDAEATMMRLKLHRRRASAWPMPWAPPVTIATLSIGTGLYLSAIRAKL